MDHQRCPSPSPRQMISSLGVQQYASEAISTPGLPPLPDHDLEAFCGAPLARQVAAPPPARQVASVTDLEALWEKGSDWIVGRWQYSDENQKALLKRRAEDAVIRSEVHRLNKDAVYEPLSCVPLSKSACALLDYLEAAVAPDVAAARDVLPTPKPLPPSAPPAPTQAQAASEAPLSVDGARRSSTPKS